MAHITLKYILSEAARRYELAQGLSAAEQRTLILSPTSRLAQIAQLDGDNGVIDLSNPVHLTMSGQQVRYPVVPGVSVPHEADHVLTEADGEAWVLAHQAAVQAKVDHLKAEAAAIRMREEAERAQRAAERSAHALALTVDDLYDAAGGKRMGAPDGPMSPEANTHLAAMKALGSARADAARARSRAEQAARLHECELWLSEHAAVKLGDATLGRAAKEHRTGLAAALRKCVRRRVRAIVSSMSGFPCANWYGQEERSDVPTADTYALLDKLVADKSSAILEAVGLPQASVQLTIHRLDRAPKGTAVWRTGILVTVSHPWLEATVVAPAYVEDPDVDGDDDDDDE